MAHHLTEPPSLPPPIAQVLFLARQRAQPSPPLLERLERFERYVQAGFADPANKSAKLGKALQWLARAMACARGTPELTLPAVPHLDELWNLVEAHMTEVGEAAETGTLLGLGGDSSPSPPAASSSPPAAPIAAPPPRWEPPMAPTEAIPLLPVPNVVIPAVPPAPRWAPVPPSIESPPPSILARPGEPVVAAPPRPIESPPAETWATDDAVVAEYAARIEGLYRRRDRAVTDLATTWAELHEIDAAIGRAMLGLSWLGSMATRHAAVAAEEADSAGASFASALLLLGSGDADGPQSVIDALVRGRTSPNKVAGIALAMRMAADPRLLAALESLLAQTDRPGLTGALLPILADHGRLRPEQLIPLLDHPVDALADRAASLLVWLGREPAHRSAVETRAVAWRRPAFLRAAAFLGSAHARELVRAAIDDGRDDAADHIETLVIAGDRSDGHRLRRLTSTEGPAAELAGRALSHLGIDADDGPERPRLLDGQPWTLAGMLSRAVAPEEPIRTRRSRALEAIVRTGARPTSAVYDHLAPADLQQRAAERVRVAFAAERQLAPGRWYYLGRASS
jgi:hypothetical protein